MIPLGGTMEKLKVFLALCQGYAYVILGLWPVIDIISFQQVTGAKTDLWLVKTVGILIAVIGLVFLSAAYRRSIAIEIILLGILSSFVLGFIDVVYALNQ